VVLSFGNFVHMSLLYAISTQLFRRKYMPSLIFHHINVVLAVMNILEILLLLNALTVTLFLKTFPVKVGEK